RGARVRSVRAQAGGPRTLPRPQDHLPARGRAIHACSDLLVEAAAAPRPARKGSEQRVRAGRWETPTGPRRCAAGRGGGRLGAAVGVPADPVLRPVRPRWVGLAPPTRLTVE